MKFLYLIVSLILACFQSVLSELVSDIDSKIIDINLPKNHLSQYFNNLPGLAKRFNETGTGFYKEFLSSDEYDNETCWGYEYQCKKPLLINKCPGNHSGYVSSKQVQFDVFHSQADFGERQW
jgi:protein O-GlcNAc transferase